jgi:hypothetical protein
MHRLALHPAMGFPGRLESHHQGFGNPSGPCRDRRHILQDLAQMKRILGGTLALAIACVAGMAVERQARGDASLALNAAGTGLSRIRGLLADILYLRADQYYHMGMFRGESWAEESDYLPIIWLVVELRPDFAPVYADGAYQLVVNLGMTEEGLRLLERGLRECPDDAELRWQNLVIRWQAGTGTPEDRRGAARDFLTFVRRNYPFSPPSEQERNAALIQSWLFEEDSTRRASPEIASLYETRWRAVQSLRRVWLSG